MTTNPSPYDYEAMSTLDLSEAADVASRMIREGWMWSATLLLPDERVLPAPALCKLIMGDNPDIRATPAVHAQSDKAAILLRPADLAAWQDQHKIKEAAE